MNVGIALISHPRFLKNLATKFSMEKYLHQLFLVDSDRCFYCIIADGFYDLFFFNFNQLTHSPTFPLKLLAKFPIFFVDFMLLHRITSALYLRFTESPKKNVVKIGHGIGGLFANDIPLCYPTNSET